MNLLEQLQRHRLLAIVRGSDATASAQTCLTLAEAGVRLIEVSLTTQDAFGVIADVAARLGASTMLGAGTVLTGEDVVRARDCGATYIVTPALAPSIKVARELAMPVLAGALTPSEVVDAAGRGAAAIKLFPASVFGPSYLRALREPLPGIPLVPVGGISLDLVPAYLSGGATAVGIGSPLCGDAPGGGDLGALRDRAAQYLAAVR